MGLQATNAGIDFQQRVSAFMMILMEFGIDVSKVLGISNAEEKIVKINFEACESIDDLVLTLESGKMIYFQMKRTISLSDDSSSEFYKVCKQFVSQHEKKRTLDLAYILMTRSEASGAIVQKLRRVLDGIRLSRSFDFISTLNKEEKDAFDKFCSNIKNIYKKDYDEEVTEYKLLMLCMKTYVEMLDIEGGEAYEKTIFLMLYDKLQIQPILFWNGLIARAVEYGANRRCVSVESLNQFFDEYKSKPSDKKKINAIDVIEEWKRDIQEEDIRFDYVVCKPTEKTQKKFEMSSNAILIMEIYRFLESEKKEGYRYVSPDMLYLKNGMELVVLFRSSTQSRCEKFLQSLNSEEDSEIILMPANKEGTKCTAAETMHKSLIVRSFDNNKDCKCINCGKSITDKTAYLIEIDNDEVSNVAGIVHKECARPIDRIIGECFLQIKDDLVSLHRFDVKSWIELCKHGKTVWKSVSLMSIGMRVMMVDNFDVFEDGNYCVCSILEDGNKHYITKRGKVERFGKTEAVQWMDIYREDIKKAKEANDPLGYTSETMSFGSYQQCLISFPNEKFIECIDAKVEPYNQVIASVYNDSNTYYAPLIYFSVDGKPLILKNGIFPLISDPFKVANCLDNWKRIGNEINDYELCIIENDNNFILKISTLISMGIRPVVDCIFMPSQELASGIPIFLKWEMEATAKGMKDMDI